MNFFKLFTIVAVISLTSCATVFSGTKGTITVNDGTPSKAQIYMNGNLMGEAPLSFQIPKKSFGKQSTIEIRAVGYKPTIITIDKRVQAGFIVLDLLTGLVELVVDFGTGAIYTPDPKTIKYTLEKI